MKLIPPLRRAFPALALSWIACSGAASHDLTTLAPQPGMETSVWITVAPLPAVDLLFVIDNGPSMAAKQAKIATELPRLIRAFKDRSSGWMPDLRVAMITTDLGTGGAYPDGPCGPKTLPDGTPSAYGDLGRFQMIGAAACGVTDPSALWLELKDGAPVNFDGDMGDVAACLAANLGTQGCGIKQPLRALEFALVAPGWGNEPQRTMLRPNAPLEIVIITDEDDCSAAANDAMFGDKPELRGEGRNLRCATRGYACAGNDLSTAGPGYPTTQGFSACLSSCAARTDACPASTDGLPSTDTSLPTSCSPLESVKKLATEIRGLKEYPGAQILIAGAFGMPPGTFDQEVVDPQFTIAPIPNPDPADPSHPLIYAEWPICYDRSHPPASSDGYDREAANWGATAGLRISAFMDQFGDNNSFKTSICEDDLAGLTDPAPYTLVKRSAALCIDNKLVDTDEVAEGVQADCRVVLRRPEADPNDPTQVVYREDAASMPRCAPRLSVDEQGSYPCWRVIEDPKKCWTNGQLMDVVRAPAERKRRLPAGTKTLAQCLTCLDDYPDPVQGCDRSPP
jgi:hypothetical protein